MEPIVLLDTNVVLARCLDSSMDAKAKLANEVFRVLSDVALKPHITESVRTEFETKLHARVGQIADAVRRLAQEPAPASQSSMKSSLEVMEDTFADLRSEATEAAGALQLLEARLVRGMGEASVITPDAWSNLLGMVAVQTSTLLAEIQKRFDTCHLEVIRRSPVVDHEKFREVVPKTDLEHIASAAGLAESKKCKVIFVTLESQLHAVRDQISNLQPDLTVTAPVYLLGQIQRIRGTK